MTETSEHDGPVGSLSALMLTVRDLDAAVAFYTGTLGCALESRNDAFAYLDAGDFLLVLNARPDAPKPQMTYFVVFRVDDIDAAHAALQAKGVTFMMPVVPFFADQFGTNFTDPDGHPLTLMGPKSSTS